MPGEAHRYQSYYLALGLLVVDSLRSLVARHCGLHAFGSLTDRGNVSESYREVRCLRGYAAHSRFLFWLGPLVLCSSLLIVRSGTLGTPRSVVSANGVSLVFLCALTKKGSLGVVLGGGSMNQLDDGCHRGRMLPWLMRLASCACARYGTSIVDSDWQPTGEQWMP